MKLLVVHCHPLPESFSAALFGLACGTLQQAEHETRSIDLYAEGFNPVLSAEERRDYLTNTPACVAGVQTHVDLLRWAEGLVFVYPTWYYGPPAMLKGWLERVWLPGVTFEPPARKGHTTLALLTNVRRLVVITHGGAPWWWLKVMGDPHKKFWLRGMRAVMHPACTSTWLQLNNMNNATPQDREAFMAKVQRALMKL
jgi:putative NADPH-quinone reductase